ncbi:hypothetical protein HDU76_010646, partial [Blyttiomyces sp. JEL0837]
MVTTATSTAETTITGHELQDLAVNNDDLRAQIDRLKSPLNSAGLAEVITRLERLHSNNQHTIDT